MNYAEDRLDRRSRLGSSSSTSALSKDLDRAHKLLDHADSRAGHDLAGRTLRDGGMCRQAVFHYGIVWKLNFEDALAAGDYAQMTEFTGYPELGILSLLYYRYFDTTPETTSYVPQTCKNSENNIHQNIFLVVNNDINYSQTALSSNCGCGYEECGKHPCYFPFSLKEIGRITNELLSSLETKIKSAKMSDSNFIRIPHASIICNICVTNNMTKLHGLLNYFLDHPLFRFWESNQQQTVDNEIDEVVSSNKLKCLPISVQLLLLKLLYCSPNGNYFSLACLALPYLDITIRMSPGLEKTLAREFKSHWAYFVLIRAIVLGNRVKKETLQRLSVSYHVPVWDVIWGMDQREIISTSPTKDNIIFNTWSHQNNPIYIFGDSHILSIAWQTIRLHKKYYTLIPHLVTGLKAYHTVSQSFFTYYNLQTSLSQLPSTAKMILLSAGEIDVREGIGQEKLKGYQDSCIDLVNKTVSDYIKSLQKIAKAYNLFIFVLPVAPHAQRNTKYGKKHGRIMRRRHVAYWNDMLRSELRNDYCENMNQNVFFLDYDNELRQSDDSDETQPVLKNEYNADFTHMNSAFLPLLEAALMKIININSDVID